MGSARHPTVVLVGNPNVGKTTLFNALSGLRAKTANYPGITVDMRQATVTLTANPKSNGAPTENGTASQVELVDLPGLYGLEPTSPEEHVAVDVLHGKSSLKPDALLVIADATNLSRSLYLASEALELDLPTVVALNLYDEAKSADIEIDVDGLEDRLQCAVVPVSAKSGLGLSELRNRLEQLVHPKPSLPMCRPSCVAGCAGCPSAARHAWAAELFSETVQLSAKKRPPISRLDRLLTAPVAGLLTLVGIMLVVFFTIFSLADLPMSLIEGGFGLLANAVESILPSAPVASWVWFPSIVAVCAATFAVGYRLQNISWNPWSIGVMALTSLWIASLPLEDFRSLILDGVIGGIGGVVVFLPQICILFFFITLLEDSGYMARGAFVMERVMRFVGLPGKAFVPMLSAHACAIPGIMATRTIDSWRDRLVTILVLPLLTCSARLPVYAMIAVLLFGDNAWQASLMFAGAYLLGLSAALLTALVLKRTVVPGQASALVIELPPFRVPNLRNALMTVVDRATIFLRKAGTVILLISLALWALATYPKLPEDKVVEIAGAPQSAEQSVLSENTQARAALEYSWAGRLGQAVEPVFAPLGFDWKINVGVISSFAAREVVVSTLSIVYGIGQEGAEDEAGLVETLRAQRRSDGSPVFTTATSLSLLVFYVLAMQCLPTQAVTKRETGSWKWAVFQLVYMTVLAYIAALVTFQTLSAMGLNT